VPHLQKLNFLSKFLSGQNSDKNADAEYFFGNMRFLLKQVVAFEKRFMVYISDSSVIREKL